MLFNPFAIKLLNLILSSNPGSRSLLAKYPTMAFKLVFPGLHISAACDIDGYLIPHNLANYDVIITIPLDSATFLIDKDKLAVYKKISFEGNTNFGRELLEILSKLHLDGIYTKVNSPFLLMALNKFTDLLKIIANYLKFLASNNSNTLKEYLMYETGDIITRFEHDQFCDDVDELKSKTEQLEQRIKQYKTATLSEQIDAPMKQRATTPTNGRQGEMRNIGAST